MSSKLMGWDDTIAALATPAGTGAIAVIRLSGPRSLEIAGRLFPSKDLAQMPSHSLQVGLLVEDGLPLDEVVLSIFKAPRSYTGEDVVEISCHGSPYLQDRILQALIKQGARPAKPGEFTQRAFLHGKLDLAQAEGVADLIASHSEASRKAAIHSVRGGFSQDLHNLREHLLRFSALIELELDFSQEDVEFADRQQLYALALEAQKKVKSLLDSFQLGNAIKQGVQVAIVGKPNSGKSTLLNTLLNENRAIVSEVAGTTRDTIEEAIQIEGILFRLIDTAGIRQHTTDLIEKIGMGKSLEKMQQADLVLFLFDVRNPVQEVMAERMEAAGLIDKFIFVANKVDTIGQEAAQEKFSGEPGIIMISAKEGLRIEELKRRLVDRVLDGKLQTDGSIVTNARHFHALQQVEESLRDILKGLDSKLPGDLLTADIRRCLHFLGEITGEITTEDQLDYIFSKFCIGK
jgi:tRNA modification GTPase